MTTSTLAEDTQHASFDAVTDIPAIALEAMPMAVYVVDAVGRIVRFNRRAVELWGRTPKIGDPEDRYCGAHLLYTTDGAELPHHDTPMAAVLKNGESQRNKEVIIERQDGTRSVVLVNIEPLYSAEGRLAGAINCFQDISEKKRLENEVRQGEALLRTVFETTPECIKIVSEDGRLLQMNGAGLGMIGAPAFSAVDGANTFNLIAPEFRAAWRDNHARVIAGERLSWEFDIVALDGKRRHMETHAAPMKLPGGGTAQLAVTRDISQRKRDERALAESNRLYCETLEALPAAIYTTDPEGKITFYNRAAVEFSGHRPVLGSASWCVSYRLFRPDGTPLPHDQCPMAVALRERRESHGETEAIAERPDGTRIPFLPFVTPFFDENGELLGAVNMLVDISETKRSEERTRLFADELNHRVKNTLAIVQSLASQTAKRAGSVAAFDAAFKTRLRALSKTHELLARSGWEQAELREIASQVLDPFENIEVQGPAVGFLPAPALSMAMVLNELATNAHKYGCLAHPSGRVSLTWTRDLRGDLCLSWREHGGRDVEPPSRKGFGLALIERTVEQGLHGTVDLNFTGEGLVCEIRMPLSNTLNQVEVVSAA